MDEKAKKQTLLMIPYGLQVLGAAHAGKATVATVNWVTQAGFNPPLVVVGIKKDSGSHAMVKDSKAFALSMLGSGQKGIAGAFFRHVEPKDGKFGDFVYETGKNGAPIVSDAPAAVECEVVGFYELGDHSIVVGKVTEAHVKRDSDPLTM
jgi:flavin reductase (DIM6/NTAB) family NADH-FMN oxidoreductase RutF